jgi:hypothetical protein
MTLIYDFLIMGREIFTTIDVVYEDKTSIYIHEDRNSLNYNTI